jgi:tRNA pseudouridine38-40 synthase
VCSSDLFDLDKFYEPFTVLSALNHFLKNHDVAILDCNIVDENFHARYSAKKRSYIYKILNRVSLSAIERNLVWQIRHEMNLEDMIEAKNYLIGIHNFTSFQSKGCYSKSPIKSMDKIEIIKEKDIIEFYFEAPSFLYHMVRKIVGNLALVGVGKYKPYKIQEILEAQSRRASFAMAPACGLYLNNITY